MLHQGRISLLVAWLLFPAPPAPAQEQSAVERGEYVFRAAGGCTCHTDLANRGEPLAGGRAIKTPFGTIYGTNITPDEKTGIGGWSDDDFIRAMTEGTSPDGTHYYPVFPYTSFTRMTREDLLDLKAYLFTVQAVSKENRPPELGFPWRVRSALAVWRSLYFEPGAFAPDPDRSGEWNRGAYLATGPGHCGECHTPRTTLGGPDRDLYYAGSVDGPEGELAPNITPDEATGIGSWSVPDITWFLQTGFKPDGDDAQGLMRELIDHGYQRLEEADLRALAAYLKSLDPIHHEVEPEKKQ